ncbi:hypothetical protein A0H81_08216 [Grifola frondosa]|uniref:Uncharacterized protein n=1 Tax=Grifola frondosa TaxID=5627 RepID=A0A1C7M4J0_GRIFR|nr:hypothetical protein A0H81_08216 [Grifola frondosa]
MNFTNINDPAGVKALLEQLRSSQAWQESISPEPIPTASTASTEALSPAAHAGIQPADSAHDRVLHHRPADSGIRTRTSDSAAVSQATTLSSSVASLLSQLQAPPSFTNTAFVPLVPPAQPSGIGHVSQPFSSFQPSIPEPAPVPAPLPSSARKQDLRSCSFQQALPHLAQLSEDPDFVAAISTMKKEQADLERQLWEERQAIQGKHEEKTMTESFRRELHRFDLERVIPAWDGLVTKQQTTLEALGVPAMFPTTVGVDRERQQKVMQVLGGIVGSEEPQLP